MSDGILLDLEAEDAAEATSAADKAAWLASRLSSLLIGSDVVLAGASASPPYVEFPGIYFQVFRDRIVYVGQASCLGARMLQHVKEGRPVDRLAFIVGLPRWILDEIEHAYIRAWQPPWNDEFRRCGALDSLPDLVARAATLDRSAVSPHYVPVVPHTRFKVWQLQLMGWEQAQAGLLAGYS